MDGPRREIHLAVLERFHFHMRRHIRSRAPAVHTTGRCLQNIPLRSKISSTALLYNSFLPPSLLSVSPFSSFLCFESDPQFQNRLQSGEKP